MNYPTSLSPLKENVKIWILVGYEIFSKEGPKGLKVEVLAKKVGKNKSSFYHHFADLEVFTEYLLNYHLERAIIIAEEERNCQNIIPELIQVLIQNKQDLLFNRQLRVHRENPFFEDCFEKASEEIGEAILEVWSKFLGLSENPQSALSVLKLGLENFYLQITEENLNYQWLKNYLQEFQKMVKGIQKR